MSFASGALSASSGSRSRLCFWLGVWPLFLVFQYPTELLPGVIKRPAAGASDSLCAQPRPFAIHQQVDAQQLGGDPQAGDGADKHEHAADQLPGGHPGQAEAQYDPGPGELNGTMLTPLRLGCWGRTSTATRTRPAFRGHTSKPTYAQRHASSRGRISRMLGASPAGRYPARVALLSKQ
jgi:hypothetical protein